MATPLDSQAADIVVENVDAIVRLEHAAMGQRSWADRLSDSIADFTGTIWFVLMHLVWFALWATINAGLVPRLPRFDPYPFALLCMIVSMEGVLLSTFVLIKQNRMGYLSDRRAHLDLQINLLAERQVTQVLQLAEQIARRLQVSGDAPTNDPTRDVQIERLMQTLDKKLSRDEE